MNKNLAINILLDHIDNLDLEYWNNEGKITGYHIGSVVSIARLIKSWPDQPEMFPDLIEFEPYMAFTQDEDGSEVQDD